MKEENITKNEVDVEKENSEIESAEDVEVVEVSISDPLHIESQDAFPALGLDNAELNHALLYSRDNPNQHPITAITGLREELDNQVPIEFKNVMVKPTCLVSLLLMQPLLVGKNT